MVKVASYIIPFNSKIDDIYLLRKVLEWLKSFKNIEVIIVEYNTKSPILDHISDPFVHIPVEGNKVTLSKSWAYNIGIKRSSSDIVICGDSSTITNPDNILKSINLIKDGYQMVRPFNKRIKINPSQLSNFSSMDKINSPIFEDDFLCGGIGVYDKSPLFKIGGWEEKFKIYNYVDFQTYKVIELLKHIEIDSKGYILGHGKVEDSNVKKFDDNLNNKLKSLNKENLLNYINTTYSSIGMVNKLTL